MDIEGYCAYYVLTVIIQYLYHGTGGEYAGIVAREEQSKVLTILQDAIIIDDNQKAMNATTVGKEADLPWLK